MSFFDAQGKLVRVIGMVADITEREHAEDTLLNLSRKVIEAQEQERTRIARELHDDIGQRLGLVINSLCQVQGSTGDLSSEVFSLIGKLQTETSQIATDIQSLSHELHSSKLDLGPGCCHPGILQRVQ